MIFLFMLYISLLAPRSASAQQGPDVALIEAAAAQYARAQFVKGTVAFDSSNAFLRSSGLPVSTRSQAELAQLSQALGGARVGALSAFRICSVPTNSNTCALHGVDAVLSMTRPVIAGDTAVVLVRIFSAHRGSDGRAFTSSRSERIQVAHQGSHWIATKTLPGGSIS
ncbi:MAG: hypothetical protein ACYC4J_04720 [Gemmatimonadaceae bacterium]